jgi:hypothetical protein
MGKDKDTIDRRYPRGAAWVTLNAASGLSRSPPVRGSAPWDTCAADYDALTRKHVEDDRCSERLHD